MQYRSPVRSHGCNDGAVRTSATLMTRPHAAFAHHGILGLRIRRRGSLRFSPPGCTSHRGAMPVLSDHSSVTAARKLPSATLLTRSRLHYALSRAS